MKNFIAIAFSISIAFSANAASHQSKEIEELQEYCAPDVERLCPGVPYGDGKVKACLKKSEKEISVGCAQALKKLKK